MKFANFLPLVLAVLLQARPLTAVVPPAAPPPASPGLAIVANPGVLPRSLFGGYDAVSSATTFINPPFSFTGAVGKALPSHRLTTSGQAAHAWTSSPSPVAPGLRLDPASGTITGTPTVAGTFTATITGWEFSGSVGPSTSSTFTFVISPGGTPPSVTTPPDNQVSAVGSNVVFSVGVSGTPPFFYQWRFGGTNLIGATNFTVQLPDVQVSQSGLYTMIVTNLAGSISTNAILTVEVPPAVTNQPSSQIVSTGAVVTFFAGVAGTPLAYQWLFNSNSLAGATSAALSLTNVIPSQSGFYSVVLTNALGVARSEQAQLLVVPPPDQTVAPALKPALVISGQVFVAFDTVAGYSYLVQFADLLDAASWLTLTNIPAAFNGATIALPQSLTGLPQRFYRVLVNGN